MPARELNQKTIIPATRIKVLKIRNGIVDDNGVTKCFKADLRTMRCTFIAIAVQLNCIIGERSKTGNSNFIISSYIYCSGINRYITI